MATLDSSVVNIAMPTITRLFHTSIAVSQWVATAYLLVIGSLLLTYGRAGDMYGHKKVYITGFVVFTFSSLLCGVAPTINALIAFRVLQALGAGMIMAAGPAIVTAVFPHTERGRALGLTGMTVAVGLSVGPVLGGFLVEALGWRSIFYINLPIGVIGSIWAYRVLPGHQGTQGKRTFDIPGAFSLFAALFTWLLALSEASSWGWGSLRVMSLLAVAAASFAVFLSAERRSSDPMVDLDLFKVAAFSSANITALLNFMAQSSIMFLAPFYLQQVLRLAPDRAGMVLLSAPLVVLVVAPLSGALSDRIGSNGLSSIGMFIIAAALFALSRLTPQSSPLDMAWRLALMGLGSGIFQSPNNSVIMGSVPRHRLGLASGMLATMRNVGMVLGIAISSSIFTARHAHYLGRVAEGVLGQPQAYVSALRDVFLVGTAFAFMGVWTSLVRLRDAQRCP